MSERVGPRPSWRQRSDSPTTSRPAPLAASSTPASPGSASTGSAATPAKRCTSSDALASERCPSAVPSSCSGALVAAASHAPSSKAAQSCSAPPKGTSTGLSGPGSTTPCSRATSTATSAGDSRSRAPTSPRGHAHAEQRTTPVHEHEVDLLGRRELDQVLPRPRRGQRHRARRHTALQQVEPRLRGRVGGVGRATAARSAGRRARRRCAAGAHAGEMSSRGGSDWASGSARARSCASAASVCGATRIECSGTGTGESAWDSRLATSSSSSTGAPNSLRGSSRRSAGPAMNVVISAMITSGGEQRGRDHALLQRQVEHDELGQPARVHQRAEHARLLPAQPGHARGQDRPPNLPAMATSEQRGRERHSGHESSSSMFVRRPV